MFKRTFVVALLALGLMAGTAHAGILSGTFTINIYQGHGASPFDGTAPQEQALNTNPLIGSLYSLGTWQYTGKLNFNDGGINSIAAFLGYGGGLLDHNAPSLALSSGNFDLTTVFVITPNAPYGALDGTILHDDGVGLYLGGILKTDPNAAKPTTPIDTDFSLAPGTFQLVYVAANGLPEQLQMNVVPDGGTTVMLLGGALMGLGFLRRKFRA
jgi:hypothetical protein